MMFTAVNFPDTTRLYSRMGTLGLLLLLGAASLVTKRPDMALRQEATTKAETATHTRVVDAVEPLYRILFPRQDVLRFMVAPGILHPHKVNETQNWIVDCYDQTGTEIAHGVWSEKDRRHIIVSVNRPRKPLPSMPLLSAAIAIRRAEEWLCHTGMAVPQDTQNSARMATLLGEVWHINVRLSEGVAIVWMNARTGEVHQVIRADGEPAPADLRVGSAHYNTGSSVPKAVFAAAD